MRIINSAISRRWWFQILANLAVFFLYYLGGILGEFVAIPPGYVSPVWPPSGIALAAMFLLGYRVWPGIFLGSFLHNFLLFSHEVIYSHMFLPALVSVSIALLAVLQASAALWLIRRYEDEETILETSMGILKFICIAMVTCLINSVGGVTILTLAGQQQWSQYLELWWTWWVGDTVGIIAFTPLIVVWYQYPMRDWTLKKALEVVIFLTLLCIACYIIFSFSLPLSFLILPFPIFAAFRYGYSGLLTVLLIINIWVIFNTALGRGPFVQLNSPIESLLLMKTYIVMLIVVFLFLISSLLERDKVKKILEHYSHDLEKRVLERTNELQTKLKEIQDMQQRVINQERLSSLGALTAGLAQEIKNPLNMIYNFSVVSLKLIEKIKENLLFPGVEQEKVEKVQHQFQTLNENIEKIKDHSTKANTIIQGTLMHARQQTGVFQPVYIHNLIELNLKLLYQQQRIQDMSFFVQIEKDFDPTISTIMIIEQDIGRVILNLLDNSFYSLIKKKEEVGLGFNPILSITTKNHKDRIIITIWDNGLGISEEDKKKIFTPFFTTKPAGLGTGLGLSVCHDIIVSGHHGEITVKSELGKFAEFSIALFRRPPESTQ